MQEYEVTVAIKSTLVLIYWYYYGQTCINIHKAQAIIIDLNLRKETVDPAKASLMDSQISMEHQHVNEVQWKEL